MRSFFRSILVLALAGLTAAGPALAGRGRTVNLETFQVDPQLCRIDEAPQSAGLAAMRAAIAGRIARDGQALPTDALLSLAADLHRHFGTVARQGLAAECQRPLNQLLNDMSDGLDLMRVSLRVEAQRVGLSMIVQALNLYGHQFQPKGWQKLEYRP
jgi:hypothetical protein